MDDVFVMRLPADGYGRQRFILRTQPENHERVKAWLRGLGDGYMLFDRQDVFRKVEGPLVVEDLRYENGEQVRRARAARAEVAGDRVEGAARGELPHAAGGDGDSGCLPSPRSRWDPGHVELVVAGDGADVDRRGWRPRARPATGPATLKALRAAIGAA